MITRRGFLGLILATGIAPAIAKYPVMRIRPVIDARTIEVTTLHDTGDTLGPFACEANYPLESLVKRVEPTFVLTGFSLVHERNSVTMWAKVSDCNAQHFTLKQTVQRQGVREQLSLWNYPRMVFLKQRDSLKLRALPNGSIAVEADGYTLVNVI